MQDSQPSTHVDDQPIHKCQPLPNKTHSPDNDPQLSSTPQPPKEPYLNPGTETHDLRRQAKWNIRLETLTPMSMARNCVQWSTYSDHVAIQTLHGGVVVLSLKGIGSKLNKQINRPTSSSSGDHILHHPVSKKARMKHEKDALPGLWYEVDLADHWIHLPPETRHTLNVKESKTVPAVLFSWLIEPRSNTQAILVLPQNSAIGPRLFKRVLNIHSKESYVAIDDAYLFHSELWTPYPYFEATWKMCWNYSMAPFTRDKNMESIRFNAVYTSPLFQVMKTNLKPTKGVVIAIVSSAGILIWPWTDEITQARGFIKFSKNQQIVVSVQWIQVDANCLPQSSHPNNLFLLMADKIGKVAIYNVGNHVLEGKPFTCDDCDHILLSSCSTVYGPVTSVDCRYSSLHNHLRCLMTKGNTLQLWAMHIQVLHHMSGNPKEMIHGDWHEPMHDLISAAQFLSASLIIVTTSTGKVYELHCSSPCSTADPAIGTSTQLTITTTRLLVAERLFTSIACSPHGLYYMVFQSFWPISKKIFNPTSHYAEGEDILIPYLSLLDHKSGHSSDLSHVQQCHTSHVIDLLLSSESGTYLKGFFDVFYFLNENRNNVHLLNQIEQALKISGSKELLFRYYSSIEASEEKFQVQTQILLCHMERLLTGLEQNYLRETKNEEHYLGNLYAVAQTMQNEELVARIRSISAEKQWPLAENPPYSCPLFEVNVGESGEATATLLESRGPRKPIWGNGISASVLQGSCPQHQGLGHPIFRCCLCLDIIWQIEGSNCAFCLAKTCGKCDRSSFFQTLSSPCLICKYM